MNGEGDTENTKHTCKNNFRFACQHRPRIRDVIFFFFLKCGRGYVSLTENSLFVLQLHAFCFYVSCSPSRLYSVRLGLCSRFVIKPRLPISLHVAETSDSGQQFWPPDGPACSITLISVQTLTSADTGIHVSNI